MLLAKSTENAIQLIIYLIRHADNDYIRVKEIAEQCNISFFILSKIAQKMIKAGILESYTGPNGGIKLVKNPSDIQLIDVVQSIEGTDVLDKCILGFEHCGEMNPCAVHQHWKEAREVILNMFEGKTLKEIIDIDELKEVYSV
ncbi:MAG: Rrf2 family transcriptional regulator [Candidatus Marinimicrobia bacterium]|nr:Rrf2 family transcriptional regulator [Candidatus Neomarinimicrobiota bacterium]MCH7763580.1 Rrf2 family transcriptional regulator [Candidatus Neomarinimicrobiota bacterium]